MKMNKERLLVLADFLETSVPKERFDLDEWVGDVEGDPELDPKTLEYKPCGTSACASGWAATIPNFQKAGFVLVVDNGDLSPSYRGKLGWEAVASFFGLTDCEPDCYPNNGTDLHSIFVTQAYKSSPTPKQVAKRIRQVVANAEK